MIQNKALLSNIKSRMWQASKEFEHENPNTRFVSFYALYNACVEPTDWNEVATRCSNNPNHEHFGKTPEAILEIWNSKRNFGMTRGNNVDDYMTSLILGKEYVVPDPEDTAFINKMEYIRQFKDDILSKVHSFIGNEVWLTSKKLGVRVRCDALFELVPGTLLIGEWKNITNYSTENRFNKLLGPLKGYDNCDIVQNNLQAYLYKYILEEHGFYNVKVLIVNFEEDQHRPIQSIFKSNYKEVIEAMVANFRANG